MALAALGAVAPSAVAEEVDDMTVSAVVSDDTTMAITETIAYDFGPTVRHGIYRDIPVYDELTSGEERHYGVEVRSVAMDGGAVPYETDREGSYLRVRIGDPEDFVTGVHEYTVAYVVTGALSPMPAAAAAAIGGQGGDAELYWDFVGDGWEVPIVGARATVTGPADILAQACFTGPSGSNDPCPASSSGRSATFGPVTLATGSALTGAAAWPASAFTVAVTQDIRPGPRASAARGASVGGVAGLLAVAGMVGLALAWRRKDVGVSMPGAPSIYGPPCGLAPAEMVAALEGVGSTATALMATFLDLSARGWMRVTVHDEVVTVTRLGAGSAELRDWESALMEAVFRGRSTVVLGEYDPNLESAWTYTGMTLVDRAEADGYRNSEAGQPDRRWLWFAGGGAILLVLAGAGFLFLDSPLVPSAGAALGLCLVVGSIAATIITPRTQTATSARLLSEVAGLRKVLGTESAASRQEFAQRSGLSPAAILATMLPYAVALGLEDAWVAAFPDLDADELAGAGLAVLGPGAVAAMVADGVSSTSGALNAPSTSTSSGGSGFSGGGFSGGFSGGGGGGGGGGSW